jgi:hypothetical protein
MRRYLPGWSLAFASEVAQLGHGQAGPDALHGDDRKQGQRVLAALIKHGAGSAACLGQLDPDGLVLIVLRVPRVTIPPGLAQAGSLLSPPCGPAPELRVEHAASVTRAVAREADRPGPDHPGASSKAPGG